jgi:hypothetical protein
MDVTYFVRLQSGTKRREMAVNELTLFVAGDQFLFLWFGSVPTLMYERYTAIFAAYETRLIRHLQCQSHAK